MPSTSVDTQRRDALLGCQDAETRCYTRLSTYSDKMPRMTSNLRRESAMSTYQRAATARHAQQCTCAWAQAFNDLAPVHGNQCELATTVGQPHVDVVPSTHFEM